MPGRSWLTAVRPDDAFAHAFFKAMRPRIEALPPLVVARTVVSLAATCAATLFRDYEPEDGPMSWESFHHPVVQALADELQEVRDEHQHEGSGHAG
jgi:hypothetical protein